MFTSTLRNVLRISFSNSSFLDFFNLLGNGGGVTLKGIVDLGSLTFGALLSDFEVSLLVGWDFSLERLTTSLEGDY